MTSSDRFGYAWRMHAQAAVPVGLSPAPRPLLAALYGLILLPLVGVLLLEVVERVARRLLVKAGRHLGALEVKSHARGARILGLVWTLAFFSRTWLLDAILSMT